MVFIYLSFACSFFKRVIVLLKEMIIKFNFFKNFLDKSKISKLINKLDKDISFLINNDLKIIKENNIVINKSVNFIKKNTSIFNNVLIFNDNNDNILCLKDIFVCLGLFIIYEKI